MSPHPLITITGSEMTLVSLHESHIESNVSMLGIKRKLAECNYDQITKVVESNTLLENKCKIIIYFLKNGKEKRFGGIGSFIEGSVSEPEFNNFLEILKSKLPTHAIWTNKIAEKIEKKTLDGAMKFKLTPSANYFLFKKYRHSGERGLYIGLYIFLNLIFLGLGIFMAGGVFMAGPPYNINFMLILIPPGLIMIYFTLKSLGLIFRGGMYKAFLYDTHLKLNHRFRSREIRLTDIGLIERTIVNVRTRNSETNHLTESYEYEFIIRPQKIRFVIGELHAKIFIQKIKEAGVKVE